MSTYLSVTIDCLDDYQEILIAEMNELGFDSFQQTDTGFVTSWPEPNLDETTITGLLSRYKDSKASYKIAKEEKTNWNTEWEKNYDPIIIDKRCIIRASFHIPKENYDIDILINPKMSFGTGHHETTYLMLKAQLEMDFSGLQVMDAGCGTAILSVMASKLGAKSIVAFDIDGWVIENAQENVALNNCDNIEVLEGTIGKLRLKDSYDCILANINKNVLLDEMPLYRDKLKKGGKLLLSGFYQKDLADIESTAKSNNLTLSSTLDRNEWTMVSFEKN